MLQVLSRAVSSRALLLSGRSPDALVVLAAPPGEEGRAGTEAAQDTGSSVLTAAATLLSTYMKTDRRQESQPATPQTS